MADRFNLEIVTPAGAVFAGEVEELRAPGTLGEFGVLPGHTPLLTAIEPGPLAVVREGRVSYYAVHGGFCQVNEEGVVVLANLIEQADSIDAARAEAARGRAAERLKEVGFTDADYGETLAALQRARARIAAVGRMPAG